MLDGDRAGVLRQHVGEPAISHRALVDVAATEPQALVTPPRVHPRAREGVLGGAPAVEATGAVDRRVEARRPRLAFGAADDDGIVAHRAANEAALAWEGRRGALADDPQYPAA